MYVKSDFGDLASEEVISLQKGKGKCPVLRDVMLTTKYPNGRKIKKAKYEDIMSLMKFVPPVHQTFYGSLKSEHDDGNAANVEDID